MKQCNYLYLMAIALAVVVSVDVCLADCGSTDDDNGCCVPTIAAPQEYQNCGGTRPTGLPFAGRSPVYSRNGMAATSQPLSTQVRARERARERESERWPYKEELMSDRSIVLFAARSSFPAFFY
jgi:hypothetical protein